MSTKSRRRRVAKRRRALKRVEAERSRTNAETERALDSLWRLVNAVKEAK